MFEYFDHNLKRKVRKIILGEFFATDNADTVLNTVLGSCVAICLTDRVNGVYGINHFMMPGDDKNTTFYGAHATNALIARMAAKGADKKHLTAKVFGGGKTIAVSSLDIGKGNAEFIKKYLHELNIPITGSDLGGNTGRNILFFCDTGDVTVKMTNRNKTGERLLKPCLSC